MKLIVSCTITCLIGCATQFALPMTAAQLAGSRSNPALVAYLGQPDASPTVCDLNATGPHVASLDKDTAERLTDALREGRIAPTVWASCVSSLLRSAPRENAAIMLDAIVSAELDILTEKRLGFDASLQARLGTLHALYLDRPLETGAHPRALDALISDLHRAIGKKHLGPVALKYGTELLAAADLEHGVWQGQKVDLAMLDGMLRSRDEIALRRCAERLPDAALRKEARARVIQLHIDASQLPEVKEDPSVAERLMLSGRNPVSLSEHLPVRGWLDLTRIPMRSVVVEQNLLQQMARVLGSAPGRSGVSVLPELSLRGVIQLELAGLGQPITLCAPERDLDPTPCLLPSDLRLESKFAYVDRDGGLRFVEHVGESDAVGLAQQKGRLVIPFSVAGRQLGAFDWAVVFKRPDDLVFSAASTSRAGRDLAITIERRYAQRLVYAVTHGSRTYLAVAEWSDAGSFHVVSRGSPGMSGSDGTNGFDGTQGTNGSSASCPSFEAGSGGSGSDGGSGGSGGDGGNGGAGGNIQVEVVCAKSICDETVSLLRRTVLSEGGAGGTGGRGGRGGRGGAGGSGGSGTTCTDSDGHTYSLSGAVSGSDGLAGSNGWDGRAGSPGPAGKVSFEIRAPSTI